MPGSFFTDFFLLHFLQRICFIAEYCTPIGCLNVMTTEHKFAGLSLEEMKRQAKDFVLKYACISSQQSVIETLGDFTSLTQLIHYEGKVLLFTSCCGLESTLADPRNLHFNQAGMGAAALIITIINYLITITRQNHHIP